MITYSEFVTQNKSWGNNLKKSCEARNLLLKNLDNIGVLNLEEKQEYYSKITKNTVSEIKSKFDTLVVIGIGGAVLGSKNLAEFAFHNNANSINIHYIDNLCVFTSKKVIQNIKFFNTAFLIISKSGETTETIASTLMLMEHFADELKKSKGENLYFITESKKNSLAQIANYYNRPIIKCDPNIGGRYSCFSLITLIPALFCGIDIDSYLQGAIDTIRDFGNNEMNYCVEGAAFLYQSMKNGQNNHVLMPYISSLSQINPWYSQLISESLGKAQKGLNPLEALGCVDQHSKLQLFLDGPLDKCYSFISYDQTRQGDIIKVPNLLKNTFRNIENKTIGSIIDVYQNVTISSVLSNSPGRNIFLDTLSEKKLAKLMMQFVIETILLAQILQINPFDQEHVEKNKVLVKKRLEEQ